MNYTSRSAIITRNVPCLISVNLKSGLYFLNFALLAVFLNCPSDLVVSYWHTCQGLNQFDIIYYILTWYILVCFEECLYYEWYFPTGADLASSARRGAGFPCMGWCIEGAILPTLLCSLQRYYPNITII